MSDRPKEVTLADFWPLDDTQKIAIGAWLRGACHGSVQTKERRK